MKELKQYYKEIQQTLPCSPKQKKHLLRQLKNSVCGFLQKHPDADIAAVRQHFGTPEQIVASCLEEMEAPQVLKQLRLRHRILKIIAVVATCIVLLWSATVIFALINELDNSDGYYSSDLTSSQ